MKQNKHYTLWALALIASLAGVSCQHEPGVEVPAEEQGPVFTAKLGALTRSHFKDEDEGTDMAGTLYWDETDRVAIISVLQSDDETGFSDRLNSRLEELSKGVIPGFEGYEDPNEFKYAYQDPAVGYLGAYIGKPMDKYIAASTALVDIQADPTEAILRPALTGAQWFANANEAVGDPYYEFMAVYPLREDAIQTTLGTILYWEGDMGCVGFPMALPREQDGVHYGQYQICVDSGLYYDEHAPMGIGGLHYMSKVLSKQETIRFINLKPVTSLLRFRMKNSELTPVEVAKLVITIEDDADVLSGATWVSSWFEGWVIPDRWTEDNNYKDVVISFDTPVPVSYTPSDPYYAVILPSYKDTDHFDGPVAANYYDAVDFRFDAYDAADNLLYTVTKTCPANGFVPGGRYDFTLDFGSTEPDDGFTLLVNAGSYRNGGDPFIQE